VITRSGSGYDVVLDDTRATLCGGAAVRFPGRGTFSEPTLTVNYPLACPGKSPNPGTLKYRYRPESETLVDTFDTVWKRG
jgi:hypothetical protein